MTAHRRVLMLNPPGLKKYARDKYCTSVSKADYYWPAVDFVFQSGYLSREHRVFLIDAIAENLGPRDVLRRMNYLRPDAVLFLTSSASWPEDMAFIERAKAAMQFEAVALGGWLLALRNQAMERFRFLDAVLLDFATDGLSKWLSGERPAENMVWRLGDEIIAGDRSYPDPFEVPLPRHDIFPLDKYRFPLARHRKFTVTNTSVGCPWKCRFCVPGTVRYRVRTVENVMEELRSIRGMGIREVLFHDSTFTAVRSRTVELLEAMISEKTGLAWMCQTRADTVDRDILKLMKRAGCEAIEFGVESGSERVLSNMSKQVGTEKIERAFEMAREEGIATNAFFIVGMPDEKEEDVEATVKLAKKLRPTVASFSVPMPHPGTPLGDAEKTSERFLAEDMFIDDVSPPKLTGGAMSPQRVFELRNAALRKFYLNPSYILHKFMALRSAGDFTRDARLAVSLFAGLYRAGKSLKQGPQEKEKDTKECPLCGFDAHFLSRERSYDLMSCSSCGLIFADPMPDEKELESYYAGVHEKIRPEVWTRHGDRVHRAVLEELKKIAPMGRVLDVGAGAGRFIEMLSGAGYDAYGVEPAVRPSAENRILAKSIAGVRKDEKPFDAITMLWVLEHIPNPDAAIAKARELLAPGGVLIVRAPNMAFIKPVNRLKVMEKWAPGLFRALINPASNKESFFELLGPPYHLYGYSQSTLRRLLEGHGFGIMKMGIDGGLRTGKPLRDAMDAALELFAGSVHVLSGGKTVLFYDVTAWAKKEEVP